MRRPFFLGGIAAEMPEGPNAKLSDHELRIAALRILEYHRKREDDPNDGTSGVIIADCLGLKDVVKVGPTLIWLKENGFIEIATSKFLITDEGRVYLREWFSDA